MSDTIHTALLADLVDELVRDAEEAFAARETGQPRGPQTGLEQVDESLGGFLAPGVHVLQAAPGAGKTAFCLQAAANAGFPALYVSAEMPRLELLRRVISRTTETYLEKLKSGELCPSIVRTLALTAVQQVPRLAIMDGTTGFASPGDHILPTAEALRDRFESRSLLVLIDALQPWARASGAGETDYDLTNSGMSAAQGIAARLACPVLCVSHRNRQGQRAGGLHAAKGSGDIEYAAETVIELTPGERMFDRPHIKEVKLGILKNRHGQVGVEVPLEFEGRLQTFTSSAALASSARPPTIMVDRKSRNFD